MRWLGSLLLAAMACAAMHSEDGLVYGEAGGEKLTMDYYAPAGPAPHPIAIIIHGGGFVGGNSKNNSEAYCADFLAPAGYAVFSINYRLAPMHPYPAMVQDVQRAIRFLRRHARQWNADPNRIALVGGSAGGYLSNMAGILNAGGIKGAKDPVDRASARVQAVVTLFGPSDFRKQPVTEGMQALLGPLIKEKGLDAALAEASPTMHITGDQPPFLLIHGDKDQSVPLYQSTHLQSVLKAARVQAVVTLFGPSDFRKQPVSNGMQALMGPLIKEKGLDAALAEASPTMYITGDQPPFLLIHGDKDQSVPLYQSTHLQSVLKAARVPCDLIIIPNGPHGTGSWHRIPGVPDWEREMTAWLNRVLGHNGPIGEGVRARLAQ